MPNVPDVFTHPASVLTLETFRLNGALLALGDAVVGPLGLSSARWQVMGAIAEARGGLPVAGIARNMGLVRQSVQRIVDELVALGLVRLVPNPHHRRAKLVQLTEHGAVTFEEVSAKWLAMADALVADLGSGEAERGAALLRHLRNRALTMRPTSATDATNGSSDAKDDA